MKAITITFLFKGKVMQTRKKYDLLQFSVCSYSENILEKEIEFRKQTIFEIYIFLI